VSRWMVGVDILWTRGAMDAMASDVETKEDTEDRESPNRNNCLHRRTVVP
jgi:hypothetical protein